MENPYLIANHTSESIRVRQLVEYPQTGTMSDGKGKRFTTMSDTSFSTPSPSPGRVETAPRVPTISSEAKREVLWQEVLPGNHLGFSWANPCLKHQLEIQSFKEDSTELFSELLYDGPTLLLVISEPNSPSWSAKTTALDKIPHREEDRV